MVTYIAIKGSGPPSCLLSQISYLTWSHTYQVRASAHLLSIVSDSLFNKPAFFYDVAGTREDTVEADSIARSASNNQFKLQLLYTACFIILYHYSVKCTLNYCRKL